MAMAVPMMAKIIMTPMMAPTMLPVAAPFIGRRVPVKREKIRSEKNLRMDVDSQFSQEAQLM